MKRVVGLILLALGVAMLVLAPLLKFYVLPSAAKTPVDQYTESTSDVQFEQLLVPSLVAAGDPDPYERNVAATQSVFVRGDVPASEQPEAQSQDLAVFDYFQRVNNDATGELITAGTARYAFDRVTSELVDCCGASVDDEPVNMTGSILPVKFPFDVQQQDYQLFNTSLKGPPTSSFQGEEEKFGINTFVFKSEVPPTRWVNSRCRPQHCRARTRTPRAARFSPRCTRWSRPIGSTRSRARSSPVSRLRTPPSTLTASR